MMRTETMLSNPPENKATARGMGVEEMSLWGEVAAVRRRELLEGVVV